MAGMTTVRIGANGVRPRPAFKQALRNSPTQSLNDLPGNSGGLVARIFNRWEFSIVSMASTQCATTNVEVSVMKFLSRLVLIEGAVGRPVDRHPFLEHRARPGAATVLLIVSLLCGVAAAQGVSAVQLRRFIDQQVGGIAKLMVPARDSDLPQPRLANGNPDPFFQTTEAKRYLGKMLFFDPARMVRIRPEFGGVLATSATASCGSCHLGEAAGKAGTLLNFAAGGEGRHYTDAEGNVIPRRRARTDILPILRAWPLFPGDALVDELPTLTDVYEFALGSPARGRKLPDPGRLLRTGRLDAVDSVARNAPAVLGAAFNNRLLLGGFAGEPDESPGGLNPFGHPAQESVALLLMDAHRLFDDDPARPSQSSVLRNIAAFRKLFRDAFPEEAAQAPGCIPESAPAPGSCDSLINNVTILRATATFIRTTVTRNTPWDRFLAGENGALTISQRRGARLFFTPAKDGGAGCYSCHSGPMLNKQVNDPDVAGAGQFVEENFHNLGLADHPLQALNVVGRKDPNFRDDGRREITGRASDAFKFRVLTLRQLKDARFFFHNGSFTRVRDVVKYFNDGVPQDAVAAAAGTLTPRFTNPRGPGFPRGLGLTDDEVDDLTDFLENALYDPAFVRFDPHSTTKTMEPNQQDLTYSVFRPDLAALGAIDGRMPSGLPRSNNDALSRRDMGLEFLDVTRQVNIERIESNIVRGGRQEDVYRITNNSSSIVDTHLLIVARGLSNQIRMENASGMARTGDPYRRVFLTNGTAARAKHHPDIAIPAATRSWKRKEC
jgi:cytochrome c peroxidase